MLQSTTFRDELASIRATRYAFNINQVKPEVASIGVPLLIGRGTASAAVSVSYLLAQDDGDLSLVLARELTDLARQAEEQIDPM